MMIRDEIEERLASIVGADNASTDDAILYVYSSDVSDVEGKPDIILRPGTASEIQAIVKTCASNQVPVIPRGAGTGATGGTVAITGGAVLDLTRMNRILDLDLDNLQVNVEPGITVDQLNEKLAKHGFFYPVSPGSRAMATIGGVVANDASGMRAFKYGTAKDYLLAMNVVMPDGTLVPIGGKTLKNVAGLDLLRLFAGSEGTLGIITSLRLKVLPKPPARGVLAAYFDNVHDAGKAIISIYKEGNIPSAMEILDKSALEAIQIFKPGTGIDVADAMLLIEFEGTSSNVREQGERVSSTLKAHGSRDIQFSQDTAEMDRLWEARSVVGASASVLKEGYNRVYQGEDICVPLAEIPGILLELRKIRDKYGLGCLIFGHVSIGSLHPAITIRKSQAGDWEKVKKMAREIHELAISVGGTVTGEHGIGVARKAFMRIQNPEAFKIMETIKHALDPNNIMNPGKIFDA